MSDLDTDYRNAGFGGSLPFGKRAALLIVDVVEAYLQPGSPLYAEGFVRALESNIRLVACARASGIPVIFTNVLYSADGRNGGIFYRKVPALKAYLPGSPLAEFPRQLQPLPGELVFTKQYASAFFGTSLASTLASLGVDTVVVTGFSTSGCVRASVLDAMQHGFVPYVVRDACGDRDARPHESNLFDLQSKYAEVVDEGRALALMQASAAGWAS